MAQEYVDVETAKQTGRAAFGEMVAYLQAHSSVRVMLVEKTDRLYRNLKDWVTVDELDVEMHFPKEGVVLSRESRSQTGPQRPRAVCEAGTLQKRRLLNFVLSNCTWEDGEVVATFRQPFDMLAETTTVAAHFEANETAKSAKNEIWLGDLDSNQD